MSEPEILSRNDVMSPPPNSLPPNQKLVKDVWGDLFLIAMTGLALLAAKWEIMTTGDFGKAFFGVLFIKATMSTGKGISLDALPFMRK